MFSFICFSSQINFFGICWEIWSWIYVFFSTFQMVKPFFYWKIHGIKLIFKKISLATLSHFFFVYFNIILIFLEHHWIPFDKLHHITLNTLVCWWIFINSKVEPSIFFWALIFPQTQSKMSINFRKRKF